MVQPRALPQRGHRHVALPAQLGVYAILSLGAFVMLFPLLNMVGMSLKTMSEMAANPLSFPQSWQWSNYATAWQEGSLGR